MPSRWTGVYDGEEWEEILAQLIIGGATAYHPEALSGFWAGRYWPRYYWANNYWPDII